MSNKKIFKKLYSKKINKDDNYREIIRRIENNNKKYSMYKKILVPVCSLVLIFVLISINVNEKGDSFNSNIDMNKDFDLYINNNSNKNSVTSTFSSDYVYDNDDYKKVDIDYEKLIRLSDYNFLVDLNIPNDLDNRQYSEVYVKENKNSGYNILQNYELAYKDNNDRNVIILVSKEYGINNESNKDNIKISNINDTKVIVYQDGIMYRVTFIYNNKYFNIVTNNISEEELINILVSIIK